MQYNLSRILSQYTPVELLPSACCLQNSLAQKDVIAGWISVAITQLPPFSLIRNFGKQNTSGNVFKISFSLAYYLTDRIKIHQSQPLGKCDLQTLLYIMLAGCDWWISIRSVDNMYD